MNWIPAWVPKWVISALPYLVVALIIALGIWKYNHDSSEVRSSKSSKFTGNKHSKYE
jgi:hypothetical protein